MKVIPSLWSITVFALVVAASPARSQTLDSDWVAPLLRVGGIEADHQRLREFVGIEGHNFGLLRSPSTLTPALRVDSATQLGWQLLAPEVRTGWNSRIPHSLNSGSLWAGRGSSLQVLLGLRGRVGPLFATLAPQFTWIANDDFEAPYWVAEGATLYRPPWRSGSLSADLPTRFGSAPFSLVEAGQSVAGLRAGKVEVGVTTEEEWWGPGVRNGLVLSNNAPGIPRLFLRTARPVRTPVGAIEFRWASGILTESLFFDTIGSNDHRSFNAMAATIRPAPVPDLTLGLSRAIVDSLPDNSELLPHSFALFGWRPDRGSQQILGLFARWVFPRDGLELYGELAHHHSPGSVIELLMPLDRSASYSMGLQWAKALSADSSRVLRLQTELSMLENRTPPGEGSPEVHAYTSSRVVQGYTQRGRAIGAAIGPGSSSQWLALDFMTRRGQIGLGLGRIRWDTDAFYTQPTGIAFNAHDVSLLAGGRGSLEWGRVRLSAEIFQERRLNYLFQNFTAFVGKEQRVDVNNTTLRLTASMAQ